MMRKVDKDQLRRNLETILGAGEVVGVVVSIKMLEPGKQGNMTTRSIVCGDTTMVAGLVTDAEEMVAAYRYYLRAKAGGVYGEQPPTAQPPPQNWPPEDTGDLPWMTN